MKTTIDLDEGKLKRVMALTGLRTRREAVDYALTQAERAARIDRVCEAPWSPDDLDHAVDPDYDVLAQREREKPA